MNKCQYCNKEYPTIRGLEVHKGRKHIDEVAQENKDKIQSKPCQCPRCEAKFDSYMGVATHSKITHKLTGQKLFMEYNHITEIPKCKCGCGHNTNYSPGKGGRFGEYLQGHVSRVNGGFYSLEGSRKSHETQRKHFASGEITQWNKGKSYEETFGKERAQKIKDTISSNKERANKISIGRKEFLAKEAGYSSWQEWYNDLTARDQYYYLVRVLTEANSHLIPGYDKSTRGLAGKEGAHQIDHIISIAKGFKQGISPEVIGSVDNLRFIPWKQNLQKGSR